MEKIVFTQQKLEILTALTKLETNLTEDEQSFYDQNNQTSMKQFTKVQETIVIKDGLVNKKWKYFKTFQIWNLSCVEVWIVLTGS